MSGKEVRINGRKCLAFDKDTLPHRSGVYAVGNWNGNPVEYVRYAYFFADRKQWGTFGLSPAVAARSQPFEGLSYYWYGFSEEQK